MNAHPSQYSLDRAALGAPVAPPDAEHLAACARCAGIVASRRAAPERPAWLETVRAPARRSPRRPRLPWLRLAALLPVAAAAIVAVILLPGERERTDLAEGTRPKGVPQVSVYLKRADAVVAWDGRTPVRSGDRLRLGVRGVGYAWVSVASTPPSSPATVLYAGTLARDGETLLPISFRVDERGSAEELSVVVATEPVPPGAHLDRPEGVRPTRWSTRITLPKEHR